MKKQPPLPEIPTADLKPWVADLLRIIEELREQVRFLEEENGRLKDEIAVLKGEQARPKFKSSGMEAEVGREEKPDGEKASGKRAGSEKRSKTAELTIHREQKCPPREIPEGSRFKGYAPYVVQELEIEARNTRFLVECWRTPEGGLIRGELPDGVDGHYGPRLKATVLYLHHQGRMTQPLLREMLGEFEIDISVGQIDALLTRGQEGFHEEKAALLPAGLAAASAVTVDDTSARHQGRSGYTTHIGNDFFAWFGSTEQKSRVNFLRLLRAGREAVWLTGDAFTYMEEQGLAETARRALAEHKVHCFENETEWRAHLHALGIRSEQHVRIATEGLLVGSLLQDRHWKELVIVSDDAGQFAVPLLLHGLCWVHAERTIHKLIPGGPVQRLAVDTVRGQLWDLYADLKRYRLQPDEAVKADLAARFDAVFTQKTGYARLDLTLRRIHRNRDELLLVLSRPEIPLHTNGSERDIREQVIRKKISGGTRSDLGRQCRDTFLSLKKTCRKLGVSFWRYLLDRVQDNQAIPPLPTLIRQRAEALSA
jgi:hypothetical protein